ncbi:hypothetical protein UAY_01814 [Enterococcus moraviensis ATCC BAA-383]|uniref:Uncharacterized protein n=1 Tax=Enterococcus moraviensis ATCC BAA-383 TaxID=1158609 RepID=R2QZ85_9ENTE|nr:hypothetical protein [Enterococcus moraviensis]EOI00711.1 hypothetical protein UAY_01814 [Enterococcus moraviensis ATCC BAA-383]EOT73060.1 hypothetical protein I586_00053 [Enterococcus moraviensis ATCC BAA-383]
MPIYSDLREIVEKEGNEKDFQYCGYQCHIRRVGVPYSGHLCGYIEIPRVHILHGLSYDEIESFYNYELPAHYGLTFSGEVEGIQWIGFDCAHSGDLCPMYAEGFEKFRNETDTYKDMDYVEKNIKEVVDFIFAHSKEGETNA